MKQFNVFIAVLVLTCFAFMPAAVRADDDLDDLDVMMEVLDDGVGGRRRVGGGRRVGV
jgi:hypothetical protein